jgi:uncharacterized protein YjeT (DUF2065 family)
VLLESLLLPQAAKERAIAAQAKPENNLREFI